MRVDLDAKVVTRDGREVGSVDRAVVDPDTNEVTHFVIGTGALFGRDILVPRADFERADRSGDTVRLDLAEDDLDALPDFVAAQYMPPPAGWMPPAGYIFPGSYLWPMAAPYVAASMPTADQAGRPTPQISLGKGATVFDRDGDDLGVVDDVRLDPRSGELRSLIVRVGGAFATLFGGGDTVEIGARHIARVDLDQVFLRLDKQEVRRETA